MALQTQNLVMVGLGIRSDSPPNPLQPPLVDGVHLRWAFKRDLGFPWYGYYLFRRRHRAGEPLCLSDPVPVPPVGAAPRNPLRTLPPGPLTATIWRFHDRGQISSNQNLLLTDAFPPGGSVELDLDNRRYLRFTPSEGPVRRIEVHLGFRDAAEIEVTARLWDTPVTQTVISGQAGEIVRATLEFDAITEVELSPGPAALIDLCFVPVSQEATLGWEEVPAFPYPMCLPLTHPDYPCTRGMSEDLSQARALARGRIRYGDPDQFTSPPVPLETEGTIAVVKGSPIVTGTGTHWREDLVGAVLQVSGDPTAYAIAMIVAPDKLVLSRSYVGTSDTGRSYAIHDDAFGQLYNYLIHLVTGAGPMANRSFPVPIQTAGSVSVTSGSPTVTGTGTHWGPELTGLALQVVADATGTIAVTNGSPTVTGAGTHWSAHLAGMTLQIAGEQTAYPILSIDAPTRLRLQRDYVGGSGAGKAYTILERTAHTIARVDSPTQLTLERNYAGSSGPGKAYLISSVLQPTDPGRAAPRMPNQYPLDLVLLGTLQPALAQMVGLYWADQTAEPGTAYDYLIVADYLGTFHDFGDYPLPEVIAASGFYALEGYIVFNKQVALAPQLAPPEGLQVYALPSSVRATSGDDVPEVSNNAGLRWALGVTEQGRLLPDKPFMYHLWRADLGEKEPPTAPPADRYNPMTKERPILIARPNFPPGSAPQRPSDWPPVPMHTIDSGLRDGWYSYQVSGIDIFGRHSPNSDPAAWYQWTPVSDPRPWYYQDPPGDRAIHPFAVGLLDKMPPPPPTGIEAYALDPDDPTVLKDAAYNAWRGANPEQVGLRVRWQWTQAHMRQAPDVREFRLYYHPGQMNALLGHTLGVSAASSTESVVETDIPNTRAANAYAGALLRIGSDTFAIVRSEGGSPLRVHVTSGPIYTDGKIAVENGSSTVTGTETNWGTELTGLTLKVASEPRTYTILKIDSPTQLTLDRSYVGVTDAGKTYSIAGKLPGANAPCTLVMPSPYTAGTILVNNGSLIVTGTGTGWRAEFASRTFKMAGESAEYTIVGVDSETQVTLDRGYEGITGSGKAYVIRHPLFVDYSKTVSWEKRIHVVTHDEPRQYEVFLPAPDTEEGEAFAPSLAAPIVYAHISVSAADDKPHTLDDPIWDTGEWGGRFGNEGRVGAPAKIFRVWREPPPAPAVPPPDSDKVFATPADYHGHSYYTYRWQPQQHLKTHIFRALDDALFKGDWKRRQASPENISADNEAYFPVEWRGPDPALVAKRNQIANALNHLNTFSHDAEGTTQAMAYYRVLSNDALRVLAGLPGNERVFTQITIQPLDPDDPANANRIGPDNPADFTVDPVLRAYVDTLDGRSTNRYFYRAAYVDGTHNRSQLSLASPPVWLPNVVPPRAPVITKVLGGDRQITLKWASNREPDLVEYQVYRADTEETTRDLRLMTHVHSEPVPAGEPTARPADVTWIDNTDAPVSGLITFYYRVVAVDDAGNTSVPSPAVAGRTFDDVRPAPPTWDPPAPGPTPNAIVLFWTSPIADLACLVQRRRTGTADWANVGGWLARGTYTSIDTSRVAGITYEYRLRVLDNRGRQNNRFNLLSA